MTDPFTVDDLVGALEEHDISVVNQGEADPRNGANECTAVVTARSARFTACTHDTPADARRIAYRRSDYARIVFQRGEIIVYLRNGASPRLREAVIDVMNAS
ncbi:hypothetical protein [Longibacter sp.]|uniref:hypothetical protein n=1 Tax=Longibacter sp. TaxID=2045415 RepID=UPI003EBBB5C1